MELLELYQFAEKLHIDIDDFQMDRIRSQSQMELDRTCHIALDSRQFHTQAEEKVALAHEVGHCATGSFYNRYSLYDTRARHERRADKKAVYTLIPLDKLIDALEHGETDVFELSEHFGVPEDFMRKALEVYADSLREASGEEEEEEATPSDRTVT